MRDDELGSTIKRRDGKPYFIRKNLNRVFYPDEWISFFNNLKIKQKITFNFLINTGARINEVRNIKIKDVDFNKRNVKIRVVKRRNRYADGNIREIPISNKFVKFLKGLITKYKLTNEDYFPILSTPASNIGMKKALQKAKINDWKLFTAHSVRKTLECWLVSLSISDIKIIKHFGHNQSTALKHYIIADKFSENERKKIRSILGDLYYSNGHIDILYDKVKILEKKLLIQNG